MKKFLALIFVLVTILFGKEIIITKYIENKPLIGIKYNGPQDVEKILKMDFTVLNHFKVDYNETNNSVMNFDINYNKQLHTLTVKYIKNNSPILIKKYKSTTYAYFPFLVHQAVYDINKYFKMPDAKFLIRKVVYSLLVAPKEANIYLADYTLSYKKLLISGGLNIFPKWIDKKQTTIFFTKMNRLPTLYMYNIYTGKMKKIMSTEGMLVVSDVDYKDKKILLTLAPKGNPDVYLFNLKTRQLIKITNYPGIDVDGKFWGKNEIAFISDRYGSPLVFAKNLKTGIVTRVLYQGKNQVGMDTYNKQMVISVRETNKQFSPNTFDLFLVNQDDDSLKRLTFGGQNMFPNFSVDGNSIMFIKRENFFSKIGIIRLNENKIFYYRLPKILQSFDW